MGDRELGDLIFSFKGKENVSIPFMFGCFYVTDKNYQKVLISSWQVDS